jgi:hypothetical protein
MFLWKENLMPSNFSIPNCMDKPLQVHPSTHKYRKMKACVSSDSRDLFIVVR